MMMALRSRHWQIGLLFAVVGTFLFSAKGIFIKLAYGYGIDTITLIALRMLFSLPFYLGLLLWSVKKMSAKQKEMILQPLVIAKISILGVLGYYVASFLDLMALQYISVQLERLVLLTYPIFVALLSWVFFKERLSGNVFIALFLSYAGISVLFGHDLSFQKNPILGTGLVVMSAFSFAFYFSLAKTQIKVSGVIFFTCVAMLGATLLVLSHFFLVHDWPDLLVQQELLVVSVILAVFCTVLPSFMMTGAISRIGAVPSAMIGTVGPFFTAIMAVLVLGEEFTIYHVIGMVLTTAGVYLLGKGRKGDSATEKV